MTTNQQPADKNAQPKQVAPSNDPWANHQPTTGQVVASAAITGLAVYGAYSLVKKVFFND